MLQSPFVICWLVWVGFIRNITILWGQLKNILRFFRAEFPLGCDTSTFAVYQSSCLCGALAEDRPDAEQHPLGEGNGSLDFLCTMYYLC